MKKEKIGFFQQLWITFFRPDQYGRLAFISTGRMVGFVFLFSLLYSIVWSVSLLITFDMNGLKQIIQKTIPDFYLEKGELHLEEPYHIVASKNFILADSDIKRFELSDFEYIRNNGDYDGILLISRENIFVYTAKDGQYNQLEFSALKGKEYTRDGLLDKGIALIRKAFVIIPLVAFPFLVILHFILALFFALLAIIFSALFGKGLSGGQVYRIGIHIHAVIIMISLIFEMYLSIIPTPVAQFVYFALGAAYLVVGVLSTGSYIAFQKQEMAQRADSPYGGYGEAVYGQAVYGQDAFSNEPIGFAANENRFAGSNTSGNQYENGNNNGSQFTSMGNSGNQIYNGNIYGGASSKAMESNAEPENENRNSYGMNMAFYGTNVLSLDGTIQTVNPVGNKSETKPEESAEETAKTAETNEEISISYHKGLATDGISLEGTEPVQTYPPVPEPAKDTVVINGIECHKSDLDLVDKYLLVGLKDSAIDNLCQLLNCTKEEAEKVIADWKQYYDE